ncbi:Ribosomal RNA adenine dimethylase [Pirellulimonas nuda]|uniref:Ribosomal RNA small subunit methyltransferase A n=1 Tax=Pirellulimonas nuda TaxID=2528009 RepID=A0A518D8K1_9BACT|nr:16S rRNA (adenine(1518)-N(6)/adenine(1519)-N(6))-dimethyltransferase RsmA [Pirellulimonas nuda]QDU87784.1 Ribosomal RNA adenine dimethylase [Pirellulimonas nuda]
MSKLREIGVKPASRHGQNFLIDLNLVRLIVSSAELGPRDVVLEVGTGTGALTEMMAPQVGAVVTVEIDKHLYELASEELIDFDNVTMLQCDALKNKNRFNPLVMDAVGEALARVPNSQLKLVANLPYSVATPIISNLLLCEHTPHMMVATIQKELADRIVADPWSKDYGALSVWMQAQCATELVREMSPKVFWPQPKVTSAIIKCTVSPEHRDAIPDLRYFHQFTKSIFLHRRKFLRANLVAAMKRELTKEQVDEIIGRMGFADDARTEQIDVPTLLAFCEEVRKVAPDWKL